MTVAPARFAFGGRLSLDLTWTLRYRAVAPTELLVEPSDLCRWLSVAVAAVDADCSRELLEAAVGLREAIHRAAVATIDGRAVQMADRSLINDWSAHPAPFRQLGPRRRSTTSARPGAEVESALAAVADDAIGLLSAGDGRLRVCEGPGCSLLFHDSSRPGRRRWCSTERCGNRVNTSSYRRRRSAGSTRT